MTESRLIMDDTSNTSSAMGTLFPFLKAQRPLDALSHDQEDPGAAVFMQRQKSSAIDVTAFSFAKPGSRQRGFSLRSLPKPSFVNCNLGGDETPSAPDKEAQCHKQVPLVKGYLLITLVVDERMLTIVDKFPSAFAWT